MQMNTWNQKWGGHRWSITPLGIVSENEGLLRTAGAPTTMIRLWQDYGEFILSASYQLGTPVDVVAAMIPIEAVRDRSGSFDPRSDRKEPGYISDAETPHRRSPGLMQTLISTAKSMARDYDLVDAKEVTTDMLFDPYYSILLGTAYLRYQMERYGRDPVLLCGAYNAGSVKKTAKNRWHILTYGETRMDRYIAWFNDFHGAVREGGIYLPPNTKLTI